jgi:hypothetical protein
MNMMMIVQITLNVVGSAFAAYTATGSWEAAVAAIAANLAALFQKPPWRT